MRFHEQDSKIGDSLIHFMLKTLLEIDLHFRIKHLKVSKTPKILIYSENKNVGQIRSWGDTRNKEINFRGGDEIPPPLNL